VVSTWKIAQSGKTRGFPAELGNTRGIERQPEFQGLVAPGIQLYIHVSWEMTCPPTMLEREFHPDQRRLHQPAARGPRWFAKPGHSHADWWLCVEEPGISNPCEVEAMAAMAHRNR
jgi:hypothetical protein